MENQKAQAQLSIPLNAITSFNIFNQAVLS